tara:strand:- start:11 stop:844 length:834 start_codon:yes stop_codon:yes gene_type:complete
MVAWQELHIQSNIPLIVLAVSLLCIAIIGFLEFKKLTNRMNEIAIEMNHIKLSLNSAPNTVINHDNRIVEKKEKEVKKGENEEINELQNMDEMDMMNQMMMQDQGNAEIIMGGMMPPPNMMTGGIASMIIGGPMMPMGNINIPNIYEEDMSGNPLNIEEEPNDKLEEMMDEKLSECSLEEDKMKDFENPDGDEFSEEEEEEEEEEEDEEESESESESESEEDEVDGIELIQGKGKVEEVKEVSRSLSIKELKEICQKMDLSTSGNKETLVKRINSKK